MSFTVRDQYPNLENLFVIYFGPCFPEEYGEPEDCLKAFCKEEEPEIIQGAIHEIRSYLYGNPNEKELESFMDQLGSYFYYQSQGFTPFTWIKHVEEYLQHYLDQTQK